LVFKVHRRFVTEGAVEPLAVVKDFHPLEDGGAGFGPRGEGVPMVSSLGNRSNLKMVCKT
jgi:hypothetical protein